MRTAILALAACWLVCLTIPGCSASDGPTDPLPELWEAEPEDIHMILELADVKVQTGH